MEGYCSTGQSPQWAVVPMEKKKIIETGNEVLKYFSAACVSYF